MYIKIEFTSDRSKMRLRTKRMTKNKNANMNIFGTRIELYTRKLFLIYYI